MDQFVKLHWAETGRPRWVNKKHIVWFSEPAINHNAGACVKVTDDENTGGTEWLGVTETPEQILSMLTSGSQGDEQF